ncbi:MAG: hypothetical protein JXJ30_01375 [Halothiobacillaceae bacterium]|nr:hypothetical protein [Halothiobacillaceae bacterium]HER35554.1 hypothetical protein [Halothiobacillaceae bacterium]
MTHAHRSIPGLRRLATAALIVSSLALAGCDKPAPTPGTPEALNAALERAVDDAIVPSIEAFATQGRELDDAVESFCAAPDAEALAAAQTQWRETATRWNRAVLYNFGPLNGDIFAPKIHYIESMRQRGIDYTTKVRHEIDRQLTAETPLDTAHFQALRQNQTGLLPLEILLFESTAKGHPQAASAILSDFRDHPRKCDYLAGISDRLRADAAYVASGWTEAFKDSGEPYRDRFLAGNLDRGATPLAVLFTSVQGHLDYLERRKLDGTLDARLADHFYANVTATLDELGRLVEGEHGFLAEAEARGHGDIALAVRQMLDAARQSAEDRDRAALTRQVETLWKLFREKLPGALGVDLGINFSDGD